MSDTESDTFIEASSDVDYDERPFRARLAENPRPALFWLAGFVVLFALEFSRYVSGFLELAAAGRFLIDGVALIPGWVGGNVADVFGSTAGTITADIVSLLLLFVFAIFLQTFVIPWDISDRFDLELTRRGKLYFDRLVVTAGLVVVAGLLAFTPLGSTVGNALSALGTQLDSLSTLPTLTSRETIPNMGHRTPDGGWDGTFLGLSPAWAWAIRFTLVWIYTAVFLYWFWKGYGIFREHYRRADWTPADDTIRRFRTHYWGLFGLFIVVGFIVLAAFAPAISPVPIEHNVYEPYNYEFEYLDESGEVQSIAHGTANLDARSVGGDSHVGPMSYDPYDRWAPLGTTPRGQDMLTHLAFGARTSLIIGLTAIGLAGFIAVLLSLLTAYYKGLIDLAVVLTVDAIISIPVLLLVMMVVVLFAQADHPIVEPLDGGLLLALIFAFAYWPGIWRSIRGPSLQVAEQEWVDAAKSYGQKPLVTMRKHMAPYVLGYIMIYGSLLLGGIIITTAALTFLGLGIEPPTPEWGRLVDSGRQYISTRSYHVSTISGILITLVVLAFNALGDGIRDAIDPEADVGGQAAATGGGG